MVAHDLGVFLITAYSMGCGGIDYPGHPLGLTATQTTPLAHHTVAADPLVLPMWSEIYIEGLGRRQVRDKGSAIKGRHLDLFMSSCKEALKWGTRRRKVTLIRSGLIRSGSSSSPGLPSSAASQLR